MAEADTSPANQSGVDTDASPSYQSGRPPTHLDNSEEDTSTNAPESPQVIFNDVQESYFTGNNLQCNFTLTSAIRPQSLDYIGLFKKGWISTRQYRDMEWVPTPTQLTDSSKFNQDITFKASKLSKYECIEYYQLSYIDASGKKQGASNCFRFRKSAKIDDSMNSAKLDDSMDNQSEYCMEKELKQVQEELKRVQEEKHQFAEECKSHKDVVNALEIELQEVKDVVNLQFRNQNREEQARLVEQISGLTIGVQQPEQEEGGQENSNMEENRRRVELQKKILSINTTFSKESNKMKNKIKDLHLCLQTVDKEYKEMYNKYCQLEEEATPKMSSSTDGSGDVKSKLSSTKIEGLERGIQNLEVASNSQGSQMTWKKMHEQMCYLSKEIDERVKMMDSFKRTFKKMKKKSSHLERAWQLKCQFLQWDITKLGKKHNKMISDYTNMQNEYKCLMDSQRRAAFEAFRSFLPPRCMAITATGEMCLRTAKVFDNEKHLCTQHHGMLPWIRYHILTKSDP